MRSSRNAFRWSLTYRLAVGLSVGVGMYVLLQVVAVLAEAMGLCAKCSLEGNPDLLPAATLGGGAAAAAGNDEEPGESPWDWLFGSSRPTPTVEGVDPPPSSPAPADPEAQQKEAEEARRLWDLYRKGTGLSGGEEGSVADEVSKAFDRVLGIGTGATDINPTGGEGDGSGGADDR